MYSTKVQQKKNVDLFTSGPTIQSPDAEADGMARKYSELKSSGVKKVIQYSNDSDRKESIPGLNVEIMNKYFPDILPKSEGKKILPLTLNPDWFLETSRGYLS